MCEPDPIPNTYAAPQWLDQEFLQSALREGLRRESLNVTTCTIKPATNVGDNFLSQMFRASARVSSRRKGSENMSIVIKSLPEGEATETFVSEHKFFSRETLMLSETLPLLQAVLDEAGGQRLFAHLLFKQDAPNNSLVLEDLCESGYRPVDRHITGLDIQHCILVVEALATFHAASLVAIQRQPDIKETYSKGFYNRSNNEFLQKYWETDTKILLECVKIWKCFPDELVDKIEKLGSTSLDKLYECTALTDGELNVLNHGDVWKNNIMFKYSNGIPTDLRFVDFQLSYCTSPVYDLLYFIFTSAQNDIKVNQLTQLLEKYHNKLTEVCNTLNFPLDFSLARLQEAFFNRLFFGEFATVVLLPFMAADSADVPDMNDYLKDEEEGGERDISSQTRRAANNLKYKQAVELVFPFMDKQGLLQ